ncbi:hypothetical protein NLU13_9721 [Sarocladium strictum]|uniref:Amidase domain-containing protein n=1 Tax=Sarocladium strictum TaxID=5046 RepID=A0AA39L4M7_SARSR|nr:hypothetical protein NLU13_9721 [Sarocladium strictum]
MRSNALITCVIAGVQYLIHPQKLGTIDATIHPDALIPVTLLDTDQLEDPNLETLLKLYDLYDDVFIPEFGSVLVEKTPISAASEQLSPHVNDRPLYRFANDSSIKEIGELPSGPYFLYGPNLYQAWRLYADDLDAFTTGIIPEDVDSPTIFRPLGALDKQGLHKAVPVPSKLYYPPPAVSGPDQPLSGVRIAVTDAMSIRGVPRTLSSRAWVETHPERPDESAELVEHLISMGAVIVGKTKTSQFTAGRDWIDASAPLSPRSDHYQRPEGSSAGASAALAGYYWLSHAVADDDRGDSLDSASQEGFFALRPSSRSLLTHKVMLATKMFSGISVSARHLEQLLSISDALLDFSSETQITKLLRITDLEEGLDDPERSLYEDFVRAIETEIGVKSRTVNLSKEWKRSVNKKSSLRDKLNTSGFVTFCHQFYRRFADFRNAYENEHSHQPFLEPTVRTLWSYGASTPEAETEQAEEEIQEIRHWLRKYIFSNDNKTAIVLPIISPEHVYRDEDLPLQEPRNLLRSSGLSALLGLPSLNAPFAQIPFRSRITNATEYRPISASIFGPHGSDVALIKLVQNAYRTAQWRTHVDTGRFTFPPAANSRNVDEMKTGYGDQQHPNYLTGINSVTEDWESPEL